MKKIIFILMAIGFSVAHAQSNVVFDSIPDASYLPSAGNVYRANDRDFWGAVHRDNGGNMRTILASGFDPNVKDEKGLTGLLKALFEESYKVAEALIDSPQMRLDATTPAGETALMMASLRGQLHLVKKLIARKAEVNKKGWTPLHYAATKGHVDIIKELLEHHAYIDAESPNGTTPLMMAAQYGSIDAVKLLLEEGADPNLVNQQGLNAMDFALRVDKPLIAEAIAAKRRKALPRGTW